MLRLGWRINYMLMLSTFRCASISKLTIWLTHRLMLSETTFSQELYQSPVSLVTPDNIDIIFFWQNIPPYMRSVQELCYSWKSRRTLSFQKPIKMLRPTKCAQLSSEIAISNEIVFQFHKNNILSIERCSFAYYAVSQNLFHQKKKVTIFISYCSTG